MNITDVFAPLGLMALLSAPAMALQPYTAGPDYLPMMQSKAEAGCAEAQMLLGQAYMHGEYGLKKDAQVALRWYRRAAVQDDWDAQDQLGELYESGAVVTQDYAEAYYWYSLASDKGYKPSWGRAPEFKGHGVRNKLSPEEIAAVNQRVGVWKPVREINLLPDQGAVFPRISSPKGIEVTSPSEEEMALIRDKAQNGDPYIQANLGQQYESGYGVKQDYSEAAKWYRKAAEQGHVHALSRLGSMYAEGRGMKQDWQKAYVLVKLSATCERFPELSPDVVAKHLSTSQIETAEKQVSAWFSASTGKPANLNVLKDLE